MRATLRAGQARRYRRPGGPWDDATLDDLSRADGAGRGLQLVDGERRFDPAVLDRAVASVADALADRGVRRRHAVLWQLPSCAESVVLFRACWRLGAVAVPLHHQLGGDDVSRLVERVTPSAVLAAPGMSLAERSEVVLVRGGGSWFEEAFVDASPGSPPGRGAASPGDIAVVLFTSGSTGRPKGVLHTHRGLASKMRSMVRVHDLGPSDAVLMPLPMAHISGLLNGILLPTAAAMTSVLMDRWDPAAALELVEAEGVSFMGGPPTLFTDMMGVPSFDTGRVGSLEVISTGGMAVSAAFVRLATERFGAQVKRTYGSTEIPTITTCGRLGGDVTAERCRETDGRTYGDSEVRTVEPDSGRAVVPGAVGEVWCRGPEMFAGYLDPEDNVGVVDKGWFRTGDLGVVDDGGWLRVVGRLKDVIIRAGENVVPAEIEAVLEAHPDVRQAVVVGCAHPRLGEQVTAVVVGDAVFDLEACRRWCTARGLARFKVPEVVVQVDEIPLLASGKPDKARLRTVVTAGAPGGDEGPRA